MKPKEFKKNVFWVGAVDWDRRLFDELIPLPDGTSYNSYLVKGSEKTALIETVDPTMSDTLVDNLNQLGVKSVDYVITNHAEQDHSGTLPRILKLFPTAKVVSTPQCRDLIRDLLLIPEEKVNTVKHGETLSLGDKTLQFIHFPWVHWPETMLTYLKEDQTLFPCDLFGSHLATSNLYVTDEATVYEAAKRYYAEIMMPFKAVIQRNMKRIEDLPIDVIAPSHGPIYDKPNLILDAYKDWIDAPPKNIVVLPYVSMHGSTKKMVDHMVAALVERGITVQQFKLTETDIGKLAISLVDAATVVIGSPTVLVGLHPMAVYAAYLTNALRPKLRFASIIGSYGWGGRMVEQIKGLLANLKVELLEPVIVKGLPKKEEYRALEALADKILEKHQEHGIR
jgi:flavorubredoxin